MVIMIYVFFAHGFEEIEAITPVDILRRAELEVATVGVGAKTITGSHGITIHCDVSDKEAGPKNLEMIVLPGGLPGTVNLEKSVVVQKFLTHTAKHDIWTAAICAAPSILGHRGMLDGKRYTCFPGHETEGGIYTGNAVEVDGKLITGKGAGVAREFSLKLVEMLAGADKAEAIRASMQSA
jgi:4-methyl-5(b-hydroxyethyl)-thiazole monophosphate biosynthesis